MTRKIFLLLSCFVIAFVYRPAMAGNTEWRDQVEAAKVLSVSPVGRVAVTGRITIVAFFASWCPPCRDEFAQLNQILETPGGSEIAVVGVNVFEKWGGKDDPARMARFIAQTAPRFPLIEGTPKLRMIFGGIERIPSLIVFNAAGREMWRFVHARGANKTHATFAELEAAVRSAGL